MVRSFLLIFLIIGFLHADDFDEFESEFVTQDTEKVDFFYNYNQFMTDFNYSAYNMSVRPLNAIYTKIVPKFMRRGVNNFFHNLSSPLRFITLFFSGKFKESAYEFGTFVGNSTIGLAGILRPFKYEKKSDFGLMLGRWGVPSGEHIVIPFLGPSNVRDALMLPFNYAAQPSFYIQNDPYYIVPMVGLVDKTSEDQVLLNEAYKGLNPYITIRDYYEKNRKDLL